MPIKSTTTIDLGYKAKRIAKNKHGLALFYTVATQLCGSRKAQKKFRKMIILKNWMIESL
jgi:hypothetical protein